MTYLTLFLSDEAMIRLGHTCRHRKAARLLPDEGRSISGRKRRGSPPMIATIVAVRGSGHGRRTAECRPRLAGSATDSVRAWNRRPGPSTPVGTCRTSAPAVGLVDEIDADLEEPAQRAGTSRRRKAQSGLDIDSDRERFPQPLTKSAKK